MSADNDDLWSIDRVAQFFDLEPRTVRDVIVKKPDFPTPVVPAGVKTRRWVPQEVRRWALVHRQQRNAA